MEGSIMQRVVRRMVAFRWHRLGFALLLVGLLVLPAPLTATPCTYTVQRGDTLWQIAARHGTSVQAILQANPQIINPDLIRVGQQLGLPSCSGPTLTPATPTPAPPPPSGSDFPTRPEHPVPPLPQELPAPSGSARTTPQSRFATLLRNPTSGGAASLWAATGAPSSPPIMSSATR
ncbi:MAG: LysM peptidoglycan-binding domain-containing protein [Ardenticatenaceae bacterium]|nr:LysM peptidoglycan-binding domain-containing protein [Ardenticatenaceae bacterium]